MRQEHCISALVSWLISWLVPSLRYIHKERLMHSWVSYHYFNLQMLSVDCIVQRVQYKIFNCRHPVLLLSLAYRIMVHGTQKHHWSNIVLIKLPFLLMSIHGNFFCNFMPVMRCIKVGASGTLYKCFGFLADFLIGSFFEIYTQGTINALLGFLSLF